MRTHSRAEPRAVTTLLVTLLLSSVVPVALSQQEDPSWLPVNLVYTGDVHGKFEPCG